MDELQEFEIDGHTFKVSVAEQHRWIWGHMKAHTFEPETFDLYKKEITNETLYVDIGSWVGPTVLYGGHLAKRTIGVEPIAESMAAMTKNLALNPDIHAKVELFNAAITSEAGAIKLYNNAFGDGMASILPSRGAHSMTFMAMGIEEFLDRVLGDESHVFIKVDTEGAEFTLVPAMCASLKRRNVKADLYVSFHGSFTPGVNENVTAYFGNLKKNGTLLAALADYGELRFWNGQDFRPVEDLAHKQHYFGKLLDFGGIDTTIFVKAT